jgi:putative flippase GtrA
LREIVHDCTSDGRLAVCEIHADYPIPAIWHGRDLGIPDRYTAIVYGLVGMLGLYGAGMVSYLVAATSCWALNRVWTFRGRGRGLAHHQWATYLLTNLSGLVFNRGTYFAMVTVVPFCAAQPVFAVAAGAVAGMMVNFTISRQVVFR